MINRLEVWSGSSPVATLTEQGSALQLTYHAEALRPLSLSLPLAPSPLQGSQLAHFLLSLLPPLPTRAKAAAALGLEADDLLGLLQHMGQDCPGDLCFLPPNATPTTGTLHPLDLAELTACVGTLEDRPLLAGRAGVSQTLAGRRPKLALCKTAEGLALPLAGATSTHVLKPDLGPWQGAALTEVFCQTLAQRVGLPASTAELIVLADGRRCSLVARYDRVGQKRLPVESFAQALGLGDCPQEADGGPSLANCFGLLESLCTDVRAEQQGLMDLVLFNALIGNSSADSSLFALIKDGNEPRLAPLHGALCAAVFPHLPNRLALRIGRARELLALKPTDALLLAAATQLEPTDLATRALGLAEKLRTESRRLADDYREPWQRPIIATLLSALDQQCGTVAQMLRGFLTQKNVA